MSVTEPRPASTYRMSRAPMLRSVGLVAAGLGALWLLLALGVVLGFDPPDRLMWVLAVGTAVWLVAAAGRLAWPPRLLELSADGYRIRARGGVGVRAAQWRQVQSVNTESATGQSVLRFNLEGERWSALPTAMLGARSQEAQREIHDRLNSAHGYRRLDRH